MSWDSLSPRVPCQQARDRFYRPVGDEVNSRSLYGPVAGGVKRTLV